MNRNIKEGQDSMASLLILNKGIYGHNTMQIL